MGAASNEPTSNLQKLQAFLRELFQFDLADLDFGIYRLLNLKRWEVETFLTTDLPARVEESFKQAAGADHAEAQKRIEQLAERVRDDIDADAIAETGDIRAEFKDQKAKATRALLAEYEAAREQLRQSQATEEDKAEVFQHVLTFFSRYYEGGDFIPRYQRTRANYAVPWTGEETLFHWANKGQHYVKTGETFRDYSFTVAGIAGECRSRFVLSDADLPPGNTKGDTRYFFPLPRQSAYDESTRTLRVPFHYRLPTAEDAAKYGKANRIQDAILDEVLPRLLKLVPDAFLQEALAAKDGPAPENGAKDHRPTLLLRRLRHFCKKNTTDYFITPHLAEFLTAELDYYLKDQVINIHDLEGDFDRKRRILRVIQALAADIIRFLAQIEDVQNRLFEKRKFVLRTDYLVTLRCVPREFWKEIITNKAQLKEWKRLFAIEPRQDLLNRAGKVNEDFLAEHPTLVINTALFDTQFTARLLATFDDLDDATDGILIHSENYQALRFMEPCFAGQIDCIYIDPPYNTGNDEFQYKDNYRHSSWLAMMDERVALSSRLMGRNALLAVSIDDNEHPALRLVLGRVFGSDTFVGNAAWKKTSGSNESEFAHVFDNTLLYKAQRLGKLGLVPRSDRQRDLYSNPDNDLRGPWASTDYTCKYSPRQRIHLAYGIRNPFTGVMVRPKDKAWRFSEEEHLRNVDEKRIWWGAKGELSVPRYKRFLCEVRDGVIPKSLWDDVGTNQHGKQELEAVGYNETVFRNPKPTGLVSRCVSIASVQNPLVLDFFAGSGTTGHAVIKLNREDGRQRKVVLVEMGDQFDAVLLPRIQKIAFAQNWKAGKPAHPPTKEAADRSPRVVKVLRMESYEEALHNLTTDATNTREGKKSKAVAKRIGEPEHRLSYLLRLPLEANASLLNVAALEHPFDYTLETLTENGPQVQRVDLVETFNWLYGLRVHRMRTWVHRGGTTSVSSANGKRKKNATKRVPPTGTRTYRVVEATRGRDKRVLVIWRDMANLEPTVERAFIAAQLKTAGDFDERWINGDSAVPGVNSLDGLFKRLVDGGPA